MFYNNQNTYNTFGNNAEFNQNDWNQRVQNNLSNQNQWQMPQAGNGWWDKTAEFLATNPVARGVGFVMQGIANSGLNPAGYVARAAGMDTQPLQAQNATEQMLEKGAQYGYDGAVMLATGNLANEAGYFGQGASLAGNIAKAAFTGDVAAGTGMAAAGGMTEGMFNPQSEWGKFAANTFGSMAAGGLTGAVPHGVRAVNGGLENALSNPKAFNAVSIGSQLDANVAARVKQQAEALQQNMYTDLQSTVKSFPEHNLDVNYALNNGQRNFNNFMQQNATREVLDFGNPNWYGRQDLVESLKTGNYTDISFGSLPENIRQQVNQIRINNAEIPLEPEMIIPAGVVKKWSGNRLVENYSPERIAQIADEIFHSPDVNVYDGSYKHIQKLVKERPEHTNDFYGFISRDKTTGQTTAKTIYERGRSLAGRQPASLQNESSAGRMRLSDLQTPSNNKLSFDEVVVNRNLPHVSGLYEGLTPEQSRLLNEAFIKAKYYNPYDFTNILPDVNYALNNGQRTRILQNMSIDDIKNRLLQIKQERFRNITPQTGLTPEEYANIVQQQADNLGVKIAEGNPDKINSGVMHFVLDDNGKISYRAPFVGTLKDTYINPDITFSKGVDKNYVRAIRDIGRNKNYLDNLITRNGNFYTKYPTSITNIAKKIGDPHNDLSVSGDFLSDMGISPSGGSNNNIALQKGIVNGQPLDVDGKKLGTLGSLAAVQEALLQQATMSQNPQIKRDLLTAEKRLNKMLPAEYTQKRQSLDKAKSLKNSYELGLNFNPEYMDYDALNLTSARDKHAFLQGRVNRILLNSSNNPELLAMVQQDIETTRKIARKQLFENNMEYIRKNQFLQNQLDKLLAEIEQNKRRSVLFKQRKIRTADKYLNDNYGAITVAGLNNGLNNAASAGARQYLIEKIAE